MCLSGFRDFLFSVIEKPFNELIDESILSVLLSGNEYSDPQIPLGGRFSR